MQHVDALVVELVTDRRVEVPSHLIHLIDILNTYDRCLGLHTGVRVLLERGLVDEAIILERPLFIDSLALAELAASDETQRGSLVIGRILESLQRLCGLQLELARLGSDVTDDPVERHAEIRRMIEEYAAHYGLATRHWRPDDHSQQMANRHGRAHEYGTLLIAHLYVHGSAIATAGRSLLTADGVIEVGDHAALDKTWKHEIGLFASHSLLHATRSACTIFGWPEPVEVQALIASTAEAAYGAREERPSS
jgi:hypothetical protein